MASELPIVSVACLCEKVLTEKDGAASLIRIVDQFIVGAPPDIVEKFNPHVVMTLFVSLKPRGHVGKYKLVIQLHGPTKSQDPIPLEVTFAEGPLSTANITVNIAVGVVRNFGDCRFDLHFEGELLTTVPFRVAQAPEQSTPDSEQTLSS